MDQLITSLVPLFVAGFAIQQFLELLTSALNLDGKPSFEKYKKPILGAASLVAGFLLAGCIPSLRILHALNPKIDIGQWDVVITAFVLSAGTDGINSIVKFMKYAKEDKKATAATQAPSVTALSAMDRV
jgi:hypothetical protein